MIETDPSDSTEQIAGLGRPDSMPSPPPMITLNTGAERATPLFGGANQVQEVMSPSDMTERRQEQQDGGQQGGVRQPAQQNGSDAMTGLVFHEAVETYDISTEDDAMFDGTQGALGDLISQLETHRIR